MTGFPLLQRLVNGPAHAIANLAKSIFNLICNADAMAFTKEHRLFELSRGREFSKLPPWRARKQHLAAVDALLREFKVPTGWPSPPNSFDSITTLKLEQTLGLAGDMGKYFLEMLNIDQVVHLPMQAYLGALQDCQQKTPVKSVEDIMGRFMEAAAMLEVLLPAYWNSPTKHYGTHLDLFQVDWKCFWASNELYHERLMGKMKRLAKHGSRDRMATLAQNWDAFQAANRWLLDEHLATTYQVLCYVFLPVLSLKHSNFVLKHSNHYFVHHHMYLPCSRHRRRSLHPFPTTTGPAVQWWQKRPSTLSCANLPLFSCNRHGQ